MTDHPPTAGTRPPSPARGPAVARARRPAGGGSRPRLRADDGSMALSLAIILPVVLLLVMLVVQGSMWWYAREAARHAARQGVDAGRVSGGDPQAAAQRAQQVAGDLAHGLLTLDQAPQADVLPGTGSEPDRLRVTVHGTSMSILPGIGGVPITQQADAPVDRFTTPQH